MPRSNMTLVFIIAAVVCLVLAIYYIVPGIYHPLTFSGTPSGSHKTHAALFAVLAVLSVIAARFTSAPSARR